MPDTALSPISRIQLFHAGAAQERHRLGVALQPATLNERRCLLLSASPSMVGGNRGLWAPAVPMEHLGARVFQDMFSLAQANKVLDQDRGIFRPQLTKRFERIIVAFMELVEAARNYPCARKAWFEYLVEQPEAATARAE